MKVLVVNGPNLGALGNRDARVYGTRSLAEIERFVSDEVGAACECVWFQSDVEGELISFIHANREADALVINPGGLTHYSVSLRDAIEAHPGVAVEVHLSNIFAREDYRRRSVTAEACEAVVAGGREHAYLAAVRLAISLAKERGDGAAG